MDGYEVIAVIAAFFIGYWLVSAIWTRRKLGSASKRDNEQSAAKMDIDSRSIETGRAWYEILNVSPSAPMPEITNAYRAQINRYHPDKVAHLGPEIRRVAEEMTTQINAAYEEAMRSRHR